MVTVKLVSEDSVNSDYVARKLKIWRENKEEESRSITQFHYTNWPEGGCPGNAGSLIELINDLQRVQRKSGNHPITVQCSNGVGRSGALCALMTALERVKTEQIVDVFRAVKSLRIQRPGIVESAVSLCSKGGCAVGVSVGVLLVCQWVCQWVCCWCVQWVCCGCIQWVCTVGVLWVCTVGVLWVCTVGVLWVCTVGVLWVCTVGVYCA